MKYCECGCGIEITKLNKHRGTIKRFIHGHNWRNKSRGGMTYEQKLGNKKLCACGCKETITEYRVKKDGRRYKVKYQIGHNRRGENVKHFWKGGVTEVNKRFKASGQYRRWRISVFERDNYTCQECGIYNHKGLGKTIELHADHIKPFAFYPELRTELDNGRTLCIDCHKLTATYGHKVITYMKGVI